jgi:hypothetical protein
MNKHIYAVGSFALALAMSGMPAIALAENDSEGQVRVQAQVTDTSVSVTAVREDGEEDRATSTERAREEVLENAAEQARERSQSFLFELEDEDAAFSLEDLKQKIEERKQELEDEEASTTPERRDIMKNANEVRLAVHALLASKDLVGGIGSQVSEIAKRMNDSIATTTNAEARIQSRGFLSRLFFGGDKTSAEVIADAAEKNQQRIDALTALLTEANVSVEVRAVLEAQITALNDAQARLKVLAEKEQKAWGLFSWRF